MDIRVKYKKIKPNPEHKDALPYGIVPMLLSTEHVGTLVSVASHFDFATQRQILSGVILTEDKKFETIPLTDITDNR